MKCTYRSMAAKLTHSKHWSPLHCLTLGSTTLFGFMEDKSVRIRHRKDIVTFLFFPRLSCVTILRHPFIGHNRNEHFQKQIVVVLSSQPCQEQWILFLVRQSITSWFCAGKKQRWLGNILRLTFVGILLGMLQRLRQETFSANYQNPLIQNPS